ncbi:MAG: amino acid--tRNA ligase-related protein [Thermodesulforhabdaceae bacterium]
MTQTPKANKAYYLERRRDVLRAIREFFDREGFLEVETPIRVPAVAPEHHIDPFRSEEWFLITSPEIQMKMLLAEGYERIYQITKVFRKGERGKRHLPEFTMLEWYRSGCSYEAIMDDCRKLIRFLGEWLSLPDPFPYGDRWLSYSREWQVFTLEELFNHKVGWNPFTHPNSENFSLAIVEQIEPYLSTFSTPCILKDYPPSEAALADCSGSICERFEVYWGGIELANGNTELTERDILETRFQNALAFRKKAGFYPLPMPYSFLELMDAMPPSAGIALGIDRLVMILSNAPSIDWVVAFTPEEL